MLRIPRIKLNLNVDEWPALRDEKAALGDAAAADEEAARLQQQVQMRDPAAEEAAAASLGRPDFNGPYCTNDDPYGTTPLTVGSDGR